MTDTRIRRGQMAADAIGSHFTSIYNGVFRDPRITGMAKAVFGLISTHEDGYGISIDRLCEDMKESRGAIRAALKSLEEFGYLVRTQQRNDDGTVGASVYEITDMPDGFRADIAAPYSSGEETPSVENRTTDATSGNSPDVETDETETRRSEPKFGFPTTDEPTTDEPDAADRTGKKNKEPEETKHSPPSEESAARTGTDAGAHTREGDTPAAEATDTADASARGRTTRARTKHLESQVGGSQRGIKLPRGWVPGAPLLEWAAATVPGVDLARELEKFRDRFCESTKAADRRTLRGWDDSWRNWMRGTYERKFKSKPLDPELSKAAAQTVDLWWAKAEEIDGATVGASKDALLRLVVGALATGVTVKQVQQALKVCDRACPPPWMLANALQGKPVPGQSRTAGPEVGESLRRDLERMHANGTAGQETTTPADLFAALMRTQGDAAEPDSVFDGPSGTVLRGEVA